jgi:hypothetical protein
MFAYNKMSSTKQFVVGSKAKASKYNQPKNKVNMEKPLIMQQIVEQTKVHNKKKARR